MCTILIPQGYMIYGHVYSLGKNDDLLRGNWQTLGIQIRAISRRFDGLFIPQNCISSHQTGTSHPNTFDIFSQWHSHFQRAWWRKHQAESVAAFLLRIWVREFPFPLPGRLVTLGTYKYCPLYLFDLRGSAKHIIKGSFVEKLRVRESEHSPAGDIDHAWNTLSKSFE